MGVGFLAPRTGSMYPGNVSLGLGQLTAYKKQV